MKHNMHAYTRKAGSQSEQPSLTQNGIDNYSIDGYQIFSVSEGEIINEKAEHLLKINAILKACRDVKNYSFVDLGCSSGYFGLQLLSKGAKEVTFVDHDDEYLDVVRRLLDIFGYRNARCVRATISQFEECHDAGMALALIHWIYCYSDQFGSLFEMIKHFKLIARDILFIEWVDPEDYAIGLAAHLSQNEQVIKEKYSKENFLAALHHHYANISKIEDISSTRELYCAFECV